VYYINIDKVKKLRKKHKTLDKALIVNENKLLNVMTEEPALDYIIRDPVCKT